ncbi:MAG: DNA recombination protein RmuC [Elusimicrobia bacterium]|nr:DNA recombination protein RmuC [Elusimicrobiota bacterium]
MDILIILLLVVLTVVIILLLAKTARPREETSFTLMQQQIDGIRKQLADGLQSNTQSVSQTLNSIMELVNKQLSDINQQMSDSQKTIGERLDNNTRVVGERLDNNTRVVGERLDNTSSVVSDVQRSLGSLSQATQRVFEVGKDISSLQEILRAPKLRGLLGELFLGDLLSQILPKEHYSMQYKFRSGETVDAIIRLGQGLVPIDSKFPLESFRRIIETTASDDEKQAARKKFAGDVKKHIDAISQKYILPDEGTFDFAMMYIPAENVYYEMIIKDETTDDKGISAYALERRVIPVSPNSFYAYLQAIVLGLNGLRVEKNARLILEHLDRLKGDFARFRQDFDVLGKHLTSAKGKYEDSDKRLSRFEEKLISSGEKGDSEKPLLGGEKSE